ncbi:MAG: AMP-binding protein [Deltaproteobacteria bacterium]|nr:AMP-binding protein [Deltaproteobacteria bacterium]
MAYYLDVPPSLCIEDADGICHDAEALLFEQRRVEFALREISIAPRPISYPELPSQGFLNGARIALLARPSLCWLAAARAIWNLGGVVVPLALSHPDDEWQHALELTQASIVLCSQDSLSRLQNIATQMPDSLVVRSLNDLKQHEAQITYDDDNAPEHQIGSLGEAHAENAAMVLFTSGTTGRPKGVVHTHRSLNVQVQALCEAWEIAGDDVILHFLPLHHVHGIVNALLTVTSVGGTIRFLPGLPKTNRDLIDVLQKNAEAVPAPTLLMAVPTHYERFLHAADVVAKDAKDDVIYLSSYRLLISGSAALPGTLFTRAQERFGQPLLERYGMSEFGMGLSNSLRNTRVLGTVGKPFSHCEVALLEEIDDDEQVKPALLPKILPAHPGQRGELLMRGPHLFSGYFNNENATSEAFVSERFNLDRSDSASAEPGRDDVYPKKWFRTGDIVQVDDTGFFRILGRSSIDILKTGGEKISALEIEQHYLAHPDVSSCAVLGIPHPQWGDEVVMAVVLREGAKPPIVDEWRRFGKTSLAVYKVPKRFLVVSELPRNAMGKVQKKKLLPLFCAE